LAKAAEYSVNKMRAKHLCLPWLFFDVLGKPDVTFMRFKVL
jgi:hypothetical protein